MRGAQRGGWVKQGKWQRRDCIDIIANEFLDWLSATPSPSRLDVKCTWKCKGRVGSLFSPVVVFDTCEHGHHLDITSVYMVGWCRGDGQGESRDHVHEWK